MIAKLSKGLLPENILLKAVTHESLPVLYTENLGADRERHRVV